MSSSANYLAELHVLFDHAFSLEELRTLCFELGVDYQSFGGSGKGAYVRELLLGMGRNGRLDRLVRLAQKKRPHMVWPLPPNDFQLPKELSNPNAPVPVQYHFYGSQVAIGPDAKVVGERGVLVEGDVSGDIVTGDNNQTGGIHANTIKADNVVQGAQVIGDRSDDGANLAAQLSDLAKAVGQGSITADSIEAQNVVVGLQYITDPNKATPTQLQQEVAYLKWQLADALAAAGKPPSNDMMDVQDALEKAEAELGQAEPQGRRVLRKLEEVAEILTESAKVTDAAQKVGEAVGKLAPVAVTIYQTAVKLFGS